MQGKSFNVSNKGRKGMFLNLMRLSSRRYRSLAAILIVGFLLLTVTACTIKLVQPFNEKLFNDTEAFYKKAAEMIVEGKAVSPKTDDQRAAIIELIAHPAHISSFESIYDALIVDSEALILQAMAGSQAIDAAGQAIQGKINEIIEASLPSKCPDLQAEFGKVSLTAKNFVDLKCLILKWRAEHGEEKLTKGTSILKKANWEGRKSVLFNTILAIQKAESFKKE
jgi:hypothetical protein